MDLISCVTVQNIKPKHIVARSPSYVIMMGSSTYLKKTVWFINGTFKDSLVEEKGKKMLPKWQSAGDILFILFR